MPGGSEPRRKFALIGFSDSTRDMAPLNDPEWAVVGMNQLQRHLRHFDLDDAGEIQRDTEGKPLTVLRHADLWFEIHKVWNTAVAPGTDHAAWLRDCEIPCYMTDVVEGLPSSIAFPVDRMIEKFDIDYFTSTVAYMVAWAIDHIDGLVEERLREINTGDASALDMLKLTRSIYNEYTIGVFGIDLIVGEEYAHQRPAAEFYLGQAMARNIEVMLHDRSALLSQRYRYGYEMEPDDLVLDSDLEARRVRHVNEHDKSNAVAIELFGRIEELKNCPMEDEAREKRLAELINAHQKASADVVTLGGALEEVKFWIEFRTRRERGMA